VKTAERRLPVIYQKMVSKPTAQYLPLLYCTSFCSI